MGLKVNGIEYEWGDVTITAMGRTFERVLEIEYDVEVEKKQIYGRGRKVKGIQRGNEKPTGSITLGQSEVEAMIRKAQEMNPQAKLTDLVMDIQICYLSGVSASRNGTDLVRDRLIGVEFTQQPKSMKQGDTDMNIKLPILFMDAQYNF
ncbi:hypothetical protein [Pinibacter soli]|uniref:Phage tail protein n=1 Tax=Pinibacter soli TaxID=3044211 RepID=A0ABT6R9N5_9BACT|nr:hypothetical protein [Pinibacter soli]MDI3319131.1 hypothetical protein [Pinibacter soli]